MNLKEENMEFNLFDDSDDDSTTENVLSTDDKEPDLSASIDDLSKSVDDTSLSADFDQDLDLFSYTEDSKNPTSRVSSMLNEMKSYIHQNIPIGIYLVKRTPTYWAVVGSPRML